MHQNFGFNGSQRKHSENETEVEVIDAEVIEEGAPS